MDVSTVSIMPFVVLCRIMEYVLDSINMVLLRSANIYIDLFIHCVVSKIMKREHYYPRSGSLHSV